MNQEKLGKHTIQCFTYVTYNTLVFNMTCRGHASVITHLSHTGMVSQSILWSSSWSFVLKSLSKLAWTKPPSWEELGSHSALSTIEVTKKGIKYASYCNEGIKLISVLFDSLERNLAYWIFVSSCMAAFNFLYALNVGSSLLASGHSTMLAWERNLKHLTIKDLEGTVLHYMRS